MLKPIEEISVKSFNAKKLIESILFSTVLFNQGVASVKDMKLESILIAYLQLIVDDILPKDEDKILFMGHIICALDADDKIIDDSVSLNQQMFNAFNSRASGLSKVIN